MSASNASERRLTNGIAKLDGYLHTPRRTRLSVKLELDCCGARRGIGNRHETTISRGTSPTRRSSRFPVSVRPMFFAQAHVASPVPARLPP